MEKKEGGGAQKSEGKKSKGRKGEDKFREQGQKVTGAI